MVDGRGSGGYQVLDRKIDGVALKLDQDQVRFRSEYRDDFQNLQANIASQIKSALGNGRGGGAGLVIPLLGTGLGIVTILGSIITFVYGDLNSSIDKADKAASKGIEKLVGALASEQTLRTDSDRRIYDAIGKVSDNVWHKDAQAEFERREDEERGLEVEGLKETSARLGAEQIRLASVVVPRAEHDEQWANIKELILRVEVELAGSLNRLAEHVNKGDDRNAVKFDDLEKASHPLGIADEVRDLQAQIRDTNDKFFRIIQPSSAGPIGPAGPVGPTGPGAGR